jgi:GntR family galactonate operon transcriptional repressor
MLVHDLGRRTVGGEFAPNTALPNEADMVARFKVSGTTFREAMKTPSAKGMVEIRPKTSVSRSIGTIPTPTSWSVGTRPAPVNPFWTRWSICAVCWNLPPLRGRPSAPCRRRSRLSGAAYQAMRDAIGDKAAHGDSERRFHAAIFAATHNFMLARMIDLIAIGIFSAPTSIIAGQRHSLPYHASLLAAISAGDPAAASAAAERLLDTRTQCPSAPVAPNTIRSRARTALAIIDAVTGHQAWVIVDGHKTGQGP